MTEEDNTNDYEEDFEKDGNERRDDPRKKAAPLAKEKVTDDTKSRQSDAL